AGAVVVPPRHRRRYDPVRRKDFENGDEWRCSCGRLLGVLLRSSSRLQLRFANEHEYIVALPVVTRCPKCNRLNMMTVDVSSRSGPELSFTGSLKCPASHGAISC